MSVCVDACARASPLLTGTVRRHTWGPVASSEKILCVLVPKMYACWFGACITRQTTNSTWQTFDLFGCLGSVSCTRAFFLSGALHSLHAYTRTNHGSSPAVSSPGHRTCTSSYKVVFFWIFCCFHLFWYLQLYHPKDANLALLLLYVPIPTPIQHTSPPMLHTTIHGNTGTAISAGAYLSSDTQHQNLQCAQNVFLCRGPTKEATDST